MATTLEPVQCNTASSEIQMKHFQITKDSYLDIANIINKSLEMQLRIKNRYISLLYIIINNVFSSLHSDLLII